MTNILVVFDHWDATQFESDNWATANWFFGPRRNLLKAIATMAIIRPDKTKGETDEIITETALDLIGYRCDTPDETQPAPTLSESEKDQVVSYLRECNEAMQPYLPDSGHISLHTYLTSPDYNELYLIIKHNDERDHTDTPSSRAGIRVLTSAC